MSNSKLKCKYKPCGAYYRPNPNQPWVNWCSPECGTEIAIIKHKKNRENQRKSAEKLQKRKIKAEKKKDADRKRKFYDADLKVRKAAARLACHRYIKARDKGLPCICCNRPLDGKIDAGHYLESGNNPLIRYNEDNIHSQSVYCNQYQGGDSDDYRGNLIKKIGIERVEKLERHKGGTLKRTCDDYRAIEKYYKNKLEELKRL